MSIAVSAYGITKSFGSVRALSEISFEVPEAAIAGFIGPDGAGKTTLFRIAATLLVPDSGTMTIFGNDTVKDYRELRKITGYMPGRFSLYQDLTVEENLDFYATVFGTTVLKNYDLIKDIYSHIEQFRNRPAGKLSGGMKQKLALSCALIHRPSLIILDEPTTGVDAVSRREFWEMLGSIRENGITIMVSTPYMDEATKCDTIALVQDGKILENGTPGSIKERFEGVVWHATAIDKYLLLKALRSWKNTLSAYPFGDSVHVTFKNEADGTELADYMKSMNISDFTITTAEPSIEDRFLQLMSGGMVYE
ncbi:MAG: ABC transporter ATP-binding protein [Bacteroidales bacterium]